MLFSLATNVCATDENRVCHTVPHWIRVFGDRLAEIRIVVDPNPPSGRIAALHPLRSDMNGVLSQIRKLQATDSRVSYSILPSVRDLDWIVRRWFLKGAPVRCQAGTPILAFLFAIEMARGPIVMRSDCDMLFVDYGWVEAAFRLLDQGGADLVEPPRLGMSCLEGAARVSTRALLLHKHSVLKWVPMPAHRLDPLRRLHRRLQGRPTWLALEQMLQREKENGRIRHSVLRNNLGYSMHVARREDVERPNFVRVVREFERSFLPREQAKNWNFVPSAWMENQD